MTSLRKLLLSAAIVPLAAMATPSHVGTAQAGNGAAFLGGMVTSHVVGGFVRRDKQRTQAQQYQAPRYAAPPPQPQYTAPPPQSAQAPAHKSVEQRMKELEGLAAKGYITKAEYQVRRKAILDGI